MPGIHGWVLQADASRMHQSILRVRGRQHSLCLCDRAHHVRACIIKAYVQDDYGRVGNLPDQSQQHRHCCISDPLVQVLKTSNHRRDGRVVAPLRYLAQRVQRNAPDVRIRVQQEGRDSGHGLSAALLRHECQCHEPHRPSARLPTLQLRRHTRHSQLIAPWSQLCQRLQRNAPNRRVSMVQARHQGCNGFSAANTHCTCQCLDRCPPHFLIAVLQAHDGRLLQSGAPLCRGPGEDLPRCLSCTLILLSQKCSHHRDCNVVPSFCHLGQQLPNCSLDICPQVPYLQAHSHNEALISSVSDSYQPQHSCASHLMVGMVQEGAHSADGPLVALLCNQRQRLQR
mmetsp:Transcript_123865/g.344739  ORF Transcript_123865/g.344739 Transcript_123865/m.344739 type:complete len:341 (-) Transcript_123865:837-1859(-)